MRNKMNFLGWFEIKNGKTYVCSGIFKGSQECIIRQCGLQRLIERRKWNFKSIAFCSLITLEERIINIFFRKVCQSNEAYHFHWDISPLNRVKCRNTSFIWKIKRYGCYYGSFDLLSSSVCLKFLIYWFDGAEFFTWKTESVTVILEHEAFAENKKQSNLNRSDYKEIAFFRKKKNIKIKRENTLGLKNFFRIYTQERWTFMKRNKTKFDVLKLQGHSDLIDYWIIGYDLS